MPYIVRTFPIIPGRLKEIKRFAAECRARHAELIDFYSRYRVQHESWHIQIFLQIKWVTVVILADEVKRSARCLAESAHPFDCWYKQRVFDVSGVDLTIDPKPAGVASLYEFDRGVKHSHRSSNQHSNNSLPNSMLS